MRNSHSEHINIARHRIEHTNKEIKAVHSTSYRAGIKTRKFEKAEIGEFLPQKFIKLALTELAAPAVFAPEKNELLRFCVDYQTLTVVSKWYSYLIPCIDKCAYSPGKSAMIPTLGINSCYRLVEVTETDRSTTAHTTFSGLY